MTDNPLQKLSGLKVRVDSLKKSDLQHLLGGITLGSKTAGSSKNGTDTGGVNSGGAPEDVCCCACKEGDVSGID